jgi:hypothetical protein
VVASLRSPVLSNQNIQRKKGDGKIINDDDANFK